MTTQDAKTLAKSREAEMARISADDDTTARVIESMVLRGDISGLGPEDRSRFYLQMCDSLGLSAASQPFAILRLNGKEILYPTRGATDQLAAIHRLNREIVDGPKVIDVAGTKLVFAACRASHPNGRVETAVATVPATDLVNALMKCETKAKRRATLSILGLGMLDETELETIPASVPRAHVETPSTLPPASRFAVVPAVKHLAADLGAIEIPAEAVSVWIKHRSDLAKIDADAREYAWKLTCDRVETIAKMSNAKVWLKRAIAEEDARRNASSGDEVIVDAETVSAAPARAPVTSSADVEAEAERRYQSGPSTPQAPAAEGRDPKTAPSYVALIDALAKASAPEEVVAAWIAHGGKLAGDGSDVLAIGRSETYKAWCAYGGEPSEAALRGAIDRARASKQADATPDTKSRSKSRKSAAAPLAKSIDHPTVAQWDARIGRDESPGHIAGGYHKRVELWRESGELARIRAVTVDRLSALLGRDESDASRWLDGCAPDNRRQERRDAATERSQAH